MHLAQVVGWKESEAPTVPDGLKVTAMATGLEHPRSVYTLPNGDVLVIESRSPDLDPVSRPKNGTAWRLGVSGRNRYLRA